MTNSFADKLQKMDMKEVRTGLAPVNLHLTLPSIIYAVPNIECNIYFENVIDSANMKVYALEVKSPVGNQFSNRWCWTPLQDDAGKTFDFELRLFNDHGKVISAVSRICVTAAPADHKRPIRLAVLGDSLGNCQYPHHLRDLMQKAGFTDYAPVGSYTPTGQKPAPGDMAHDAYGGFAWKDFLQRWWYSSEVVEGVQDKAEREQMRALGVLNVPKSQDYRLRSPLLRLENGRKILDIPNWLNRINSGKSPDFIIIELGANDMFNAAEDGLDQRIKTVMSNAKTLLAALRKHSPQSVIGVTTAPLGCSQDAFGTNYGCLQSRYQFRRNIQRYNREIVKLVRELNDPAVEIVPIHQSIDPVNSYIKRSQPVNSRSKIVMPIEVNALHPTLEGGCQIGDAIYGWVRNNLAR